MGAQYASAVRPVGPLREAPFERLELHREDLDLQSAELRLARNLLLGRRSGSQRSSHELLDLSVFHDEAVQPLLARRDAVVSLAQAVLPLLARHRTHFSGGDLDGAGPGDPIPPAGDPDLGERDPHGLRLPHGQHHSATSEPLVRDRVPEVVRVLQREVPQVSRKGIILAVVRDPHRPVEVQGTLRVRVHLGKAENQSVIL